MRLPSFAGRGRHHAMADDTTIAAARPTGKHRGLLAILVGWVLLVRLGALAFVYSEDASRCLMPDSASYTSPACSLLETGRLAAGPDTPDVPMIVRTPGYPAFIALVYLVFGKAHVAVIAAQVILSALSIVVVYHVSYALWGSAAAFLSALLLSVDPATFLSSQLVLTETPFAFLLTTSAGAGALVVLRRPNQRRWAFVSGLFLALATLVRPITYYLVVPIAVGWLLHGWSARWGRRRVLSVVVLTALPSLALVGGWQIRNYRVSGSAEYSQIGNYNALYYRAAGIVAQLEGIPFRQAQGTLMKQRPLETPYTAPASVLAACGGEGWGLVRRHPVLFAKDVARGMVWVLFHPASRGVLAYLSVEATGPDRSGDLHAAAGIDTVLGRLRTLLADPAYVATFGFEATGLFLSYAGVLYCLWRIARRGRGHLAPHVLMVGMALYLLVLSSGPESNARFRVPLAPFIALYGGAGLSLFLERFRFRRTGRAVGKGQGSRELGS